MKHIGRWVMLCGLLALLASGALFAQDLIIYTQSGCPYCDQAREFLEEGKKQHPGFQFEERNLTQDPEALTAYLDVIIQHEIEIPAVPLILVGDQVFVGYRAPQTPQLLADLLGWGDGDTRPDDSEPAELMPSWLSLDRFGLPAFTVILGLMDGFNPCAMWVLMFLLSMLVHVKSRKRMFLIAGIFVLVSGVIYFLFMAAWLNFFLAFRWSAYLRILIGLLGLIMAGFHLKDFFMGFKGPSLSISMADKNKIGTVIRSVITARNMPLAILMVSTLAVLVNFYELLCTAGLPALYTQILVNQNVEGARFYGFLLLYNAAYIFDDSVMVFSATWALSSQRLNPPAGRALKGLSGALLLLLSLLLIFRPDWLSFTT
jgi:glutaredoxin